MPKGISLHIGLNHIDPAYYGDESRLSGCENNNRDYINESVAFEYQYDGENWQQPSSHLELRLKPNYSQPLYCALLFFDGSNGDITPALLSGVWLSHIDSTQQGKLNTQPIVKAYE